MVYRGLLETGYVIYVAEQAILGAGDGIPEVIIETGYIIYVDEQAILVAGDSIPGAAQAI